MIEQTPNAGQATRRIFRPECWRSRDLSPRTTETTHLTLIFSAERFVVTTSTSLLKRLQGSAEARDWERFVRIYTPVLYHWIRRQGVVQHEAADLVQEIFTTLVTVLPRFEYDRQRGFGNWLCTLTANKCRDFYRRRAVRKSSALNEVDATLPDSVAEFTQDEYHRSVAQRALQIMQGEFEEKTWKSCVETVVHGRPAREVASELGISINAVYVAKSRVLRRLRQELEGLLE